MKLKITNFLKKHLNIDFVENIDIFVRSLTHKSCHNIKDDYESLEFLGDSLIHWIISKKIYKPNLSEALMTQTRTKITQAKSLIISGNKIDLKDLIKTGKSMNYLISEYILGDVFESLCAAIYLSFGMKKTEEFIEKTLWSDFLMGEFTEIIDYKTKLQELAYSRFKAKVVYRHEEDKSSCLVNDLIVRLNKDKKYQKKKDYEQLLAQKMILKIENKND